MKFVFIIGSQAVGKMTVGQELMKITDLRLFHNHMTIEPCIEIFGYYDTMTEAFYYKKLLMNNNWDKNVLKRNISERIEVDIIIDPTVEYKVQLNFCPKCKSRLKIGAEECPSCGINIKEYLYKN